MPSTNHFSHGQDVWVIAGHHMNRRSAEHAAKVVRCNIPPSSQASTKHGIMVEWHSTGSAEVVSIDRVRPMYEDNKSSLSDDTFCADSSSKSSQQQQPTRKSRRASKKPDRYDNCFVNSKYQSMPVASLRKKCKAMGIGVKGCAKGDMIALVVKKEEKERWRRDNGEGENNECIETIEGSESDITIDVEKALKQPKPKKKKRLAKAAKASAAPVKKSPMMKSTSTPCNVHLSEQLYSIFSPTRSNDQPTTKPRRLSEIRRRRNNMEERVRTKILTARKKSRQEVTNDAIHENGGNKSCERLFGNESDASNTTILDDFSPNSSGLLDMVKSPATVCYSMPTSPSTSSQDLIPIKSAEEDAVQIHLHNPDPVEILYGRLHLAKADYIQSLQALQQMKCNGGHEADEIVELEIWKSESRANVNKFRTMLNKALEKSNDADPPALIHV